MTTNDWKTPYFVVNGYTQQFLDGLTGSGGITTQPSMMVAAIGSCDYTGTSWRIFELSDGFAALQCLGDVPGSVYLNGHTSSGAVDLVPNTDPDPYSGTHWLFNQVAGGYTIRCEGTGDGSYRWLQAVGTTVQLSTSNTQPGTVWTVAQLQVVPSPVV